MKLIEILERIAEIVKGHDLVEECTITTLEDMIVRVSENKNVYNGAFLVYDVNDYAIGEQSIRLGLSIVICDKLRANDSNKAYIHSNTLSIAIELVQQLRTCHWKEGYDFENFTADVWTEQFSDALLAGTKLDFDLLADLGGFCDIINC